MAALGLYVISDLRLQADDEAQASRPGGHKRMSTVDAPPNSTAAFMATVTKRGDAKKAQQAVAPEGDHSQAGEQTDQQLAGAGATTSSAAERDSDAVEDAGSSGARTDRDASPNRASAPETVRTPALGSAGDVPLAELFGRRTGIGDELDSGRKELAAAAAASASATTPSSSSTSTTSLTGSPTVDDGSAGATAPADRTLIGVAGVAGAALAASNGGGLATLGLPRSQTSNQPTASSVGGPAGPGGHRPANGNGNGNGNGHHLHGGDRPSGDRPSPSTQPPSDGPNAQHRGGTANGVPIETTYRPLGPTPGTERNGHPAPGLRDDGRPTEGAGDTPTGDEPAAAPADGRRSILESADDAEATASTSAGSGYEYSGELKSEHEWPAPPAKTPAPSAGQTPGAPAATPPAGQTPGASSATPSTTPASGASAATPPAGQTAGASATTPSAAPAPGASSATPPAGQTAGASATTPSTGQTPGASTTAGPSPATTGTSTGTSGTPTGAGAAASAISPTSPLAAVPSGPAGSGVSGDAPRPSAQSAVSPPGQNGQDDQDGRDRDDAGPAGPGVEEARVTTDLPVAAVARSVEAADYADAPLAPIIDLREVNRQHPGSIEAAINAGEVEVITTLIEQGMLSTDGPITDRDVRTMVYVAFTSNELRKLLLAGGTPDGPNYGLDLGPVELFDERVHAPAPKRLYAGSPELPANSQLG